MKNKNINYFLNKIEEEFNEFIPNSIKPDNIISESIILNSMNSLILIVLIDSIYEISISDEDLKKCNTFSDLYNHILSKC